MIRRMIQVATAVLEKAITSLQGNLSFKSKKNSSFPRELFCVNSCSYLAHLIPIIVIMIIMMKIGVIGIRSTLDFALMDPKMQIT